MKFLIATQKNDIHAIFVKLSLESLGHQVNFFCTADQPLNKNSMFLTNFEHRWQCLSPEVIIKEENYDVVWWRRTNNPSLPKDILHPEDYVFAQRENLFFLKSLQYNISPDAWWINPLDAGLRADYKIYQLRIAQQCELVIPPTLSSNDPQEIRNFLIHYKKQGVIYKTLFPNFWQEEDTLKVLYTVNIAPENLPEDFILQLTPGIYQQRIMKQYELRVIYFGGYIVAAKINLRDNSTQLVDWRVMGAQNLLVEPYELPTAMQVKIKNFMKKMGLVFGALDFIVTPEEEYIFLEVNEQGQFLWLEHCNYSLRILDIFINFMVEKSTRFSWSPSSNMHTISKYKNMVTQATTNYGVI